MAPFLWGELGLVSLEKRKLSGHCHQFFINTWKEGTQKTEPGFVQQFPGTRSKVMGTNWNTGSYPWTSGNSSHLHDKDSTGKGCPGKLQSFSWRNLKVTWTWPWETGSRWSCFSRGVGQDDLQRSLPTMLGFCEHLRKKEALQFTIFRINCTLNFTCCSNLSNLIKCWAVVLIHEALFRRWLNMYRLAKFWVSIIIGSIL